MDKLNYPFSKLSLFLLIIWPSILWGQKNLNGLVIHPENPYFLFYKKRFIVSLANNNHGAPLNIMAAHKINHYEITHPWIDGKAPMLAGNRFPVDGNIVFNQDYFDGLKQEISQAQDLGIAVTIVLFVGPAFESDRTPGSRFGQNPWNACLGGPIDIGECPFQKNGTKSSGGLKQFLTLESYDYTQPLTRKYQSYDRNWPLARKVQYRQEEIINKLMGELGHLDNWMINIMWEIDDQTQGDWQKAKDWANWIAGYIHYNFDPNRLVFTGEVSVSTELETRFNADFYADIASNINGSQHEGIVSWGPGPYENLKAIGNNNNGKPKIIIGYDPWNCNGEISDKLCLSGSGCLGADKIINFIRAALLTKHGAHPSTPFHFVQCQKGQEKILAYIKALQDFLETVDSWHNEPGDEIRDSTLPRADDFSFTDLPDGDGRRGWPRYENGNDTLPPSAPKGVSVEQKD
ncbi:MAG: hypothetical protein D6813_03910 [Calditrichaeota bacterium]|nr:MAG: hypothetical protein D6813_03910 [Calditrichota bacterium]